MKRIILDYKVDPELFNETAKYWAALIEGDKCQDEYGKERYKRTKKAQVRSFYDQILKYYNARETQPWDEIEPFVKMLNSKVAYGVTREVLNCRFAEMMAQCIEQVNSPEKLKIFKLFFEAVLGFYKGRD
jgi:CRISPR-associated protein Csm2